MYKFLGLQPPTKKQKTSSEREEKHNNYDRNICERAFRKSWNENRPWLKYIQEENKMHCVTCREAAKVDKSNNNKNVYIAGTDKFKSDSVEYHELSKNHQKAMKIVAGRNKPNETPAMKMVYGHDK